MDHYIRLTALFSRTTTISRHHKGKSFWILMKQEMMGGTRISWTVMQIISTSLQTDNHSSLLSFLQARCTSCRPTNSVKALKANQNSWTDMLNTILRGEGRSNRDGGRCNCSEEVIKSIWLRLRNQPQLLDNFEMLLRRLTSQLQRSHVDYYALQKTFRAYASCWLYTV